MSALVEITLPQCFVNAAVELMSAPLNGGLSVGLPAQDRAASRQPITINLGSWSLPLPGSRVWCITGDGAAKACFTSDSRVSRRACILVTRARRASVLSPRPVGGPSRPASTGGVAQMTAAGPGVQGEHCPSLRNSSQNSVKVMECGVCESRPLAPKGLMASIRRAGVADS